MEREKVIELARNLGWEYDEEDGHIYYDGTPITTMLTVYSRHLSKLVEQETLERAARVAEKRELHDGDFLKNSDPRITIADEIRNLKDNHDKE